MPFVLRADARPVDFGEFAQVWLDTQHISMWYRCDAAGFIRPFLAPIKTIVTSHVVG